MPELLLEVGCEELPPAFAKNGSGELAGKLKQRLEEMQVSVGAAEAMATPRRLIVFLSEVDERQPDREERKRGPSETVAFEEGEPTKALLGFCRGQGVDPSSVEVEDGYVYVTKQNPGRPTAEILAELIPEAVRALSIPKTMRWADKRLRFARPIRWILALFGSQVVEFEIAGVEAGNESRGHRFYAPESFAVQGREDYLEQLRARKVEPDEKRRAEIIRTESERVAQDKPELDEALVQENVFLTEYPQPLVGEFDEKFLRLPEPVLVTAMAKHERFFPVRGEDGRLKNKFVSVRNGGVETVVREGNRWVLNARFNDAAFFYDEDRKRDLDFFLERTASMAFQEKLGTVRQRADRLAALLQVLAQPFSELTEDDVRAAATYCKADLSTGLVNELASLQGKVGGAYARLEGRSEVVSQALENQYRLDTQVEGEPGKRLGALLLVADQVDKMAGFLGIGMVPSGSSDPYGLRRAAALLVEATYKGVLAEPDFNELLTVAVEAYRKQGIELDRDQVVTSAAELFRARYQAAGSAFRYDVLEAVGAVADPLKPESFRRSASLMTLLAPDTEFVQSATRPINIVQSAQNKGTKFEGGSLDQVDSPEATRLLEKVEALEPRLYQAYADDRLEEAAVALRELKPPINAFFDSTMVMVDDTDVRDARLKLLARVNQLLYVAGDFSKLVVEG
jgi:glycyl-tRNA synthetase beta chain